MKTQLDEATASLTPQEAEAVLQLWAKRQGEIDSLRTRMSVQDIAEAISIPPSEVDAMLREVRRNQSLPPAELPSIETRKRRNRWLIAIATVVWVGLLTVGILAAYAEGQAAARGSRLAFAPVEAPEAFGNPTLPEGVSASFRGYTVDGKLKGPLFEEQIAQTLYGIVEKVASPPLELEDSATYSASVVTKALSEENAADVPGALKFEDFRVSLGKEVRSVRMPIALTSDKTVAILVENEQRRKIGILANQTQRFSEAK